MGLFDSYQLANSRAIPEYVGSAIPELRAVNSGLQEKYNIGREYSDLIDQAVKTSSASTYDQPILDQLKEEYRGKLKTYAEKGDYENMWRNVAMDARDFAGKYKPIAQNQQAIGKYFGELDDRVAKGEITKQDYEAKTRQVQDNYTGLQMDPATGQYKNQFNERSLVKAPDFIAKINSILTNTHAMERGYQVTGMSKDNDYIISNGSNTKTLPWAKVKQFIDAGMAIDPDVQSYLSQEKDLAPYKYGYSNKLTEDQAKQIVIANKSTIGTDAYNMALQGHSWKEALAGSLTNNHLRNLQSSIYGLGEKGVIDEKTSSHSATMSAVGADRIKRDEEAPIRFLVPGSDTRLEEKDKDLGALNTSVGDITKTITGLKDKLTTAPDNEKALIQAEITRNEDALHSKLGIINGAKETVARNLGYKNYSDYQKSTGTGSGIKYDDKGQRILEWKTTDATVKGGSTGPAKTDAEKRFDAALETEIKSNAANYAFKPLNMSLTDDESKGLKNIVVSQPNAFQWFQPGSTKAVDPPKDFDINQIQVVEKGGVYYLQANETSTKKGEKGTPTGDVYTVMITPGSNIGAKIAQNMVGKNRRLTPEMARAAASLAGYTFNGDIVNLQNNESYTVRDSNGDVFATVKREPYQSMGGSRYVLYDEHDRPLKSGSRYFESNDADQISQWIQESLTKTIQQQNKK